MTNNAPTKGCFSERIKYIMARLRLTLRCSCESFVGGGVNLCVYHKLYLLDEGGTIVAQEYLKGDSGIEAGAYLPKVECINTSSGA